MDLTRRATFARIAGLPILFGGGAVSSPSQGREINELDQFVGRDLWTEQLSDDQYRRLSRLIGGVPKGYMFEPAPWRVWRINNAGNVRYIALLGQNLVTIPGGSSAGIQILDANANRLASWSFQTGWRIALRAASLECSEALGSTLITIETEPVINGRRLFKEFFALVRDRLRTVRLEDDKGHVVQNEYVFPNYEIGIAPDAKTFEEWGSLLASADKADVLAALVFLGGVHLDPPQRRSLPEPHESKYAALFERVINNPPIRARVERLTESEDKWIREAAELAARDPDMRPFD